jgi:predicted dehydrogenase
MLYRINAGTVPKDSWIQREEGGGRIVGEVCHFVDTLTFLAGAPPIEVHAVAARDRDDAVSLVIRFADGSTGAVIYSSLGDAGVAKEYIEVFTDGRVVQVDDFHQLSISRGGKTSRSKAVQDKGQGALVTAFLAAANGSGPPPIPLSDLVAVTEATFAIEEALRVGRGVTLTRSTHAVIEAQLGISSAGCLEQR